MGLTIAFGAGAISASFAWAPVVGTAICLTAAAIRNNNPNNNFANALDNIGTQISRSQNTSNSNNNSHINQNEVRNIEPIKRISTNSTSSVKKANNQRINKNNLKNLIPKINSSSNNIKKKQPINNKNNKRDITPTNKFNNIEKSEPLKINRNFPVNTPKINKEINFNLFKTDNIYENKLKEMCGNNSRLNPYNNVTINKTANKIILKFSDNKINFDSSYNKKKDYLSSFNNINNNNFYKNSSNFCRNNSNIDLKPIDNLKQDLKYNYGNFNDFNYLNNNTNKNYLNTFKSLNQNKYNIRICENNFKSNEQKMYDKLIEEGLTKAGASAILGSISLESNFKSEKYENAFKKKLKMTDKEYVDKTNSGEYDNFIFDRVGFGLAQWTYHGRKKNLLEFCDGDIGNFDKQTEFLIHELKNSYPGVWNKLKKCKDLKQCSDLIVTKYERPAGCNTENVKNKRYRESMKFFNRFSN